MIYDDIKDVVSRRIKLHIEDDFGTQNVGTKRLKFYRVICQKQLNSLKMNVQMKFFAG